MSANGEPKAEHLDSSGRALYRIGGAAALIAVVIFRRNFGTELVQFRGFGIIGGVPEAWPQGAVEWFALLQSNRFVGLVLFDLVDLVNYALVGLMLLALYGALQQSRKSAMAIATACGLAGVTVHMASNQVFSMLALSGRYAAATTDVQRATFAAAGEALLAMHNPGTIYQGTGIYCGLFLVTLAGLILSVVMLWSEVFGRATAVIGLLANGIGLCHFVALAFASAVPWLPWFPIPISAPFRVTWYVLIARKLFQLARTSP
jgi:hypothetical protein